jgi:SpoVK/Ycf46/Vps4 family AAA+-type ATPase
MLVVFASNLDPYDLVDSAFLRRIQTKIKIGVNTDDQFRQIFHRIVKEREIAGDEGIVDQLIESIRETMKQELRSCYPRDIVNQICWEARYEGRKPYLNSESLKRAVDAYFLPRD